MAKQDRHKLFIQFSRDMAYAFGLGLTVEFQWELGNDTDTSRAIWAGSAAVARGIPSIDVEMAPGMGMFGPSSIELAYQGVLRVMGHLGIIKPTPENTNNNLPGHCLVKQRHFIEAPQEGSWIPLVDTGTFVKEGTLLGYTTNFFGRERSFEALAPSDGLLLIRFESPPVQKGDTLVVIAVLDSSEVSCQHFQHNTEESVTNCILWQFFCSWGLDRGDSSTADSEETKTVL